MSIEDATFSSRAGDPIYPTTLLQPYKELDVEDSDTVEKSSSRANAVVLRIACAVFLYIVGSAILLQVTPRVVLDNFNDDHAKASQFNGWLTFGTSAVQFLFLPIFSAASDTVGRRPVMSAGLLFHVLCCAGLGLGVETAWALRVLVATQMLGAVCLVVTPMAQATVSDLMRSEAAGGGLAHGFGIIAATFGLGLSVGPLLGGWLVGMHRAAACYTAAALSLGAWVSMHLFGWAETLGPATAAASAAVINNAGGTTAAAGATAAATGTAGTAAVVAGGRRERTPPLSPEGDDGEECGAAGVGGEDVVTGEWAAECSQLALAGTSGPLAKTIHPIVALRIFLENRTLTQLAFSYMCFILSVDGWSVIYLLLSYRFGWGPVQIGAYFSSFGALLAFSQGVLIRYVVPRLLSERAGVPFGLALQAIGAFGYAASTQGWMFYVTSLVTFMYTVADPCIVAIMVKQVCPQRQGLLLGALTSLRNLCQGIGAPIYGILFSKSISPAAKNAIGLLVPGAPFILAGIFSSVGAAVAWRVLHKENNGGSGGGGSGGGGSSCDSSETGARGRELGAATPMAAAAATEEGLTEPLLAPSNGALPP